MDRLFDWAKKWGLPGSFVLTCLLSLEAIVLFCIFPVSHRLLAMIAMLLSTVGDILLMNFRRLFTKIPYFEIGAGFFMAAHVFYAGAYGNLSRARELPAGANDGTVIAGAILLCIAALMVILALTKKRVKRKQIPLLAAYILFIGLDFFVIATYAAAVNRWFSWLAFAGALSFLVSDTIIGVDIAADTPRLARLIWTFYPIGQIILIACA